MPQENINQPPRHPSIANVFSASEASRRLLPKPVGFGKATVYDALSPSFARYSLESLNSRKETGFPQAPKRLLLTLNELINPPDPGSGVSSNFTMRSAAAGSLSSAEVNSQPLTLSQDRIYAAQPPQSSNVPPILTPSVSPRQQSTSRREPIASEVPHSAQDLSQGGEPTTAARNVATIQKAPSTIHPTSSKVSRGQIVELEEVVLDPKLRSLSEPQLWKYCSIRGNQPKEETPMQEKDNIQVMNSINRHIDGQLRQVSPNDEAQGLTYCGQQVNTSTLTQQSLAGKLNTEPCQPQDGPKQVASLKRKPVPQFDPYSSKRARNLAIAPHPNKVGDKATETSGRDHERDVQYPLKENDEHYKSNQRDDNGKRSQDAWLRTLREQIRLQDVEQKDRVPSITRIFGMYIGRLVNESHAAKQNIVCCAVISNSQLVISAHNITCTGDRIPHSHSVKEITWDQVAFEFQLRKFNKSQIIDLCRTHGHKLPVVPSMETPVESATQDMMLSGSIKVHHGEADAQALEGKGNNRSKGRTSTKRGPSTHGSEAASLTLADSDGFRFYWLDYSKGLSAPIEEQRLGQETQQNEWLFKCDQCSQSFNRYCDLKRHKIIHQAKKPFSCEHCKRGFARKYALKSHTLLKVCIDPAPSAISVQPKNAEEIMKPFHCKHCNKNYLLPSNDVVRPPLQRLGQEMQQNDRPFRCGQCSRCFKRNHDLKRHKKTHLAVKFFTCEHCKKKSFTRKDE